MHQLITHEQARIIEVKLTGLCSMDEFRAFIDELRSAIVSFPPGDQPPASLYDFTGAMIQTQEVVAAMKAFGGKPSYGSSPGRLVHRGGAGAPTGTPHLRESTEHVRVQKPR